MQEKSVFLIGFMGVGKTTLGKKLANKLGIPFIDIDQEIEKLFDMTINSIFEKFGETFFRTQETKILLEIITREKQHVVSVGGGLPCFNNNMDLMNEKGITCYLQRPPKELYQRLKNSTEERPLLRELNDEQLLKFIEDKLLERENYYNQAKHIISRNQQDVKQLIKTLGLES